MAPALCVAATLPQPAAAAAAERATADPAAAAAAVLGHPAAAAAGHRSAGRHLHQRALPHQRAGALRGHPHSRYVYHLTTGPSARGRQSVHTPTARVRPLGPLTLLKTIVRLRSDRSSPVLWHGTMGIPGQHHPARGGGGATEEAPHTLLVHRAQQQYHQPHSGENCFTLTHLNILIIASVRYNILQGLLTLLFLCFWFFL